MQNVCCMFAVTGSIRHSEALLSTATLIAAEVVKVYLPGSSEIRALALQIYFGKC